MLLNQTAVYGLRAMAVLASLAPTESLNARELSERTGVPQQYLSKVMRKFVIAKLVRSQRGRGGGFGLMRPPARIRLSDVLHAIDVAVEQSGCAFGYGRCDATDPCALHSLWEQLRQSLDQWGNGTTLADIGPALMNRPRRADRAP